MYVYMSCVYVYVRVKGTQSTLQLVCDILKIAIFWGIHPPQNGRLEDDFPFQLGESYVPSCR